MKKYKHTVTTLFKVDHSLHYIDGSSRGQEERKKLVRRMREEKVHIKTTIPIYCFHTAFDCEQCFNKACHLNKGDKNYGRKSTAGCMTRVKIKRPLYSIWKDEESPARQQWKLQMTAGIASYARKCDAESMANALKKEK